MPKSKTAALVPIEHIAQSIFVLRSHKVLLDADLAALYGVATKVLLQAVKRNLARFPEDFMIQLTAAEWATLRSQIGTSKAERGGRRYAPYAFTEQGVAMVARYLEHLHADRGAMPQLLEMRRAKARGME